MGDSAGHEDRALIETLCRPPLTLTFEAFEKRARRRLTEVPKYARYYFMRLKEMARDQARAYAILLTKVSDEASRALYAGAPADNIKYVSPNRLEKFVDSVLPQALFRERLLHPVLDAFWRGLIEGGMLRAQHARRYVGYQNHRVKPDSTMKAPAVAPEPEPVVEDVAVAAAPAPMPVYDGPGDTGPDLGIYTGPGDTGPLL